MQFHITTKWRRKKKEEDKSKKTQANTKQLLNDNKTTTWATPSIASS